MLTDGILQPKKHKYRIYIRKRMKKQQMISIMHALYPYMFESFVFSICMTFLSMQMNECLHIVNALTLCNITASVKRNDKLKLSTNNWTDKEKLFNQFGSCTFKERINKAPLIWLVIHNIYEIYINVYRRDDNQVDAAKTFSMHEYFICKLGSNI